MNDNLLHPIWTNGQAEPANRLPLCDRPHPDAPRPAQTAAPWPVFDRVEQAKQEWEATVDALPQLICLIDGQGRVMRANRTLERWGLGKVTTVKGTHLHALLHSGCAGEGCDLAMLLAQAQTDQQPGEMAWADPHLGRHLLVKLQPVPARGQVEEPTTVVIVHDITAQKQAEAVLERAQHVRQEIIRNMSHELRTPLTVIQGYTLLLQRGPYACQTGDQQQALAVMAQNCHRLQALIDRLILLQSLTEDAVDPMACDVRAVLTLAIANRRRQAEEAGVRLHLEGVDEGLGVAADLDLLVLVLDNLLENAVKFGGGRDVRVRAWQEESEVVIAVSDEGIGIAPDEQERIFASFHQVDGSSTRAYGGLGLGLALCRKIAQLHGGRIWVESPGRGEGSTFFIALPTVPANGSPAGHAAARPHATSSEAAIVPKRLPVPLVGR